MERKDSWPAWTNTILDELNRIVPAAVKTLRGSPLIQSQAPGSKPQQRLLLEAASPLFIINFPFIYLQCQKF